MRAIVLLLVIFSCVARAQTAAPAPANPAAKEKSQTPARSERETEIAGKIIGGEVVWLSDSRGQQFLAVYQDSERDEVKGAFIIVPDQYDTIDMLDVISPLRMNFPKFGWSTLTISMLPAQVQRPKTRIQQVAKGAEAKEEKSKDTAAVQYEKQNLDRIDAAITWLKQKNPPQIILLGHGTGGMWSAAYVSERGGVSVKRVVGISTYAPGTKENRQALQDKFTSLKIPVLDIYAQHDYDFVKKSVQVRRRLVRKNRPQKYRRKKIEGVDYAFSHGTDDVIKFIRGWLKQKKKKQKKGDSLETDLISA